MAIGDYLKKNFQIILYAVLAVNLAFIFNVIPATYKEFELKWVILGINALGVYTISLKREMDIDLIRRVKRRYFAEPKTKKEELEDLDDLDDLDK